MSFNLACDKNEKYTSLIARKPDFCQWENKGTDQLRSYIAVTVKLISAFVFTIQIVQSLFFLNSKFQDSSTFLWIVLHLVGNLEDSFSYVATHIILYLEFTSSCRK